MINADLDNGTRVYSDQDQQAVSTKHVEKLGGIAYLENVSPMNQRVAG